MDKASCENMEIRKIVAKLVGLELSGLKLYVCIMTHLTQILLFPNILHSKGARKTRISAIRQLFSELSNDSLIHSLAQSLSSLEYLSFFLEKEILTLSIFFIRMALLIFILRRLVSVKILLVSFHHKTFISSSFGKCIFSSCYDSSSVGVHPQYFHL